MRVCCRDCGSGILKKVKNDWSMHSWPSTQQVDVLVLLHASDGVGECLLSSIISEARSPRIKSDWKSAASTAQTLTQKVH